jgi:hypothetical protein
MSFERRVKRLSMVVGALQRQHPKCHATLRMMGWRVSTFLAQRSYDKNFLLPPLFSLLHLKRCVGLAKLQSGS